MIPSDWPMKNNRKLRWWNARSEWIIARPAGPAPLPSGELLQLLVHLRERGGKAGEALLLLRDDQRRRALDKVAVFEPGLRLGDLRFEPQPLLVQALALGGHVHLDLQHHAVFAHDRDRRARRRQRALDDDDL